MIATQGIARILRHLGILRNDETGPTPPVRLTRVEAGSPHLCAPIPGIFESSASARKLLGLASEQSLYNLSERTVELEVIPALRHLGIGFIPWSPLGMGLLSGVLRKQAEGRAASPLTQMRIEKHRPQLEAYEAFCDEFGETPTNVALAWLLHNPVVSAVIGAPRTIEQFRQNLKAPSIKLSAEALAKLDKIWPGPGEAPQAYAW